MGLCAGAQQRPDRPTYHSPQVLRRGDKTSKTAQGSKQNNWCGGGERHRDLNRTPEVSGWDRAGIPPKAAHRVPGATRWRAPGAGPHTLHPSGWPSLNSLVIPPGKAQPHRSRWGLRPAVGVQLEHSPFYSVHNPKSKSPHRWSNPPTSWLILGQPSRWRTAGSLRGWEGLLLEESLTRNVQGPAALSSVLLSFLKCSSRILKNKMEQSVLPPKNIPK